MSKALVTFATGEHTRLLDLSLPLFKAFANRHGYELMMPTSVPDTRPASWWKVQALIAALRLHDAALWIDCDVAIVDGTADIDTTPDAWQALVMHHTQDGEVPNCGVWYVKREMLEVLQIMWGMRQYITHVWWEQAAMLQLLGYNPNVRPCQRMSETPLYNATQWLPLEWNSHEQNDRADNPRFAHATPNGIEWRINVMRRYIDRVTWL